MIPLSEIEWGPIDAIGDKHFSDKWIEPSHVKRCLREQYWIVSGEKGSGKTAIRKALTDLYNDRFVAIAEVDFNRISFEPIYKNIKEIARTTSLPLSITLSNYWQYAILVEIMNSCAQSRPERYGNLAPRPGVKGRISLNERILLSLEAAWNKIDEFTGVRSSPGAQQDDPVNLLATSGLSAEFLHDLSVFPLDSNFKRKKLEFFRRLRKEDDRAVVILDGFDQLKNDESHPDSINSVFSALIDAIRSLQSDPELPDNLFVKAFIPHDRYLSLNLRDSDKVDTMHAEIRWTSESLRSFLAKRIEASGKVTGSGFANLWKQVLPEAVNNPVHALSEDTFEFILRHTMYRPRQMQIHLESLKSDYTDQVIDPSMVPKSIAESSKRIAKYFIEEYKLDHPHLRDFIFMFRRKPNIMDFSAFRETLLTGVKRYHPNGYRMSIENKIDDLYAMGLFGILNFLQPQEALGDKYLPPSKGSRKHYLDFFYREPHPSVSSILQDDDQIAIHPIFNDYAGLQVDSNLIVG